MLHEAALLRHFLAVVNERSISAAAQRLAISQPALTKSIRKLETYLGAPLFERLPRGVSLTAFGETLLPHARRIEAECQFAETEMKALRGGHSGRLRLGAGPFFGAALLPAAIAKLQPRFPDLRVELDVGTNEVTHPRLFEGELDAVFCRLPDRGRTAAVDIAAGIHRHRIQNRGGQRASAARKSENWRTRTRGLSMGDLSSGS